MKPTTVLLASCLAFFQLTLGAPTTSSTPSKTSTVLSKSSTSLPKTTTTKITSTKTSSTLTKTPTASSKATTYDINFDERTPNPVLAALNPVGVEDTIFFNSWAVNKQPGTAGVPAHSQPNAIVTATEQQALNGTPSLTILYPGSKIKSFDFRSFFFGCTGDTAATAADVAVQCTIAVAGFRNNKEVAVASFTFSPPAAAVDIPMIQAVLPKTFVNLDNATLIQDDPVVKVLVADNFDVTTHT